MREENRAAGKSRESEGENVNNTTERIRRERGNKERDKC